MKRRLTLIALFLPVLWLASGCQTQESNQYWFKLPDYDQISQESQYRADLLEDQFEVPEPGTYPTGVLPLHEKDQQAILHCIEQEGSKLVGAISLADWDARFNHITPGLVRAYLTHRKDQTKLAFAVLHTSRGWQVVAYRDAEGETHGVKD